jgi:hypothetical protein
LSLLEVAIVLAITAILLVATFSIVLAVTRGDESIRTRVELQLEATMILRQVCGLLKASGPQETIVPGSIPPVGNGIFDPGEYPAFAAYNAGSTAPKWSGVYAFLNNPTPPPGASAAYPPNSVITPMVQLADLDVYPPVPIWFGPDYGTQVPMLAASGNSTGPYTVGSIPGTTANPRSTSGSGYASTNIVEIAFRVPKSLGGAPPPTDLPAPPIKLEPVNLATGAVEWGTEVFVIALVPGLNYGLDAAGNQLGGYFGNELQLRMYNATTQTFDKRIVLGRYVERILFEARILPAGIGGTPGFYMPGNYDSTLGQNEMRVTIWLVKKDVNGKLVKVKASNTFNFRSVIR